MTSYSISYSIYTDGSCLKNPGKGGWGFVIYEDSYEIKSKSGSCEMTTNNQMELQAIIEALTCIHNSYKHKICNDLFIVYTDSTYAYNGISKWIAGWKMRNWKGSNGKVVKNVEQWQKIDELLNKDAFSSNTFKFKWVKAHASSEGNIKADKLAHDAALKCTDEAFNIQKEMLHRQPNTSLH